MAKNFISKQRFTECVEILKKEEEVTKWIDLDQDTIYRINSIHLKISPKFGDCWLSNIEDQKGETLKVWTPGRMVTRIKEKRKPDEAVYFISQGVGRNKKDKKTYNNFDLMFEKDVEHEIFVEEKDE